MCQDATFENITINGTVSGIDFGNVMIPDPLVLDTLCANTVQTAVLEEKVIGEGISVMGDLLPSLDQTYNLGNLDAKWDHIYAQDGTFCGNLVIEGNIEGDLNLDGSITANSVIVLDELCINGNLLVSTIHPKVGGNIRITGNLIVDNIVGPDGKVEIACVQYSQGDVETTDSTQAEVVTIDMVDDNVCYLDSRTVGEQVGGANSVIAFQTRHAFRNVGGTVTTVGTRIQNKWASAGGAAAWDEDFVIVGTTVEVRVTGVNGKTINWRCCVERVCV